MHLPEGSLLSPSLTAAVCGGNVLTSQRIVDVVLKAFHACAASQGCTKCVSLFRGLALHPAPTNSLASASSNLTFGAGGKDKDGKNISGWGYYEVRALTPHLFPQPHPHPPSFLTLTNTNSSLSHNQTIAGGSGAGPSWHGTSGVHTHITNTRIGDVEILERRYPVLIHRFGLREGSGGTGRFNGGDGVVRDIEFTEPLQVSILSEVSPS